MSEQRVFLLQCPHITAVSGQIPGVQLTQRCIQKFAPSFRRTLDKAQMPGVEHYSRKAARQPCRPFGRSTVHRGIPPGALGVRRAHRDTHAGRVVRLLIFLPGALGDSVQHRECFSTAHKLGILSAPEALAAGQQPDSFQQVRLALAVVAADDGQLPAGFQPGRCNVAVIRDFQ